MRVKLRKVRAVSGTLTGVSLVFLATSTGYAQGSQADHVYRARAIIQGAANAGISGIATFTQTTSGFISNVLVEVVVLGLKPGERHGLHLHEYGSCGDTNSVTGATGAFMGAGGHYDPGPNGNSNPDGNHPFHMGDLPNLGANDFGVALLSYRTSRVTLSPGPVSLFHSNEGTDVANSAVILHLNEDQGTTGVTGGSGGARIACGVIERVSGFDDVTAEDAKARGR